MNVREKSDYLRIEVLTKNFLIEKKKTLENIKKQRFYYVSIHNRIKKRAEELWLDDITRSDMDNWLLAEKQIKYEDYMKAKKFRQDEEMIYKCLQKIYNRN